MMHVLFRGVGHKLTATTAEEAVKEAKLDWNVFKANIQTVDDFDGNKIPITREMGIFREDTKFPLGVVGRGYGVIQNAEAASILNDVIDRAPSGSPIAIRHGACIFGGDKVFLTAEVGDPILIGRESFSRFIIISWGHNGGVALKASFALCRLSTGAIINVKMRGIQSDIKIRHSRKANERLKIASRVIENAFTYFEKIADKFTLLADSIMSDLDFSSLLDAVLPLPVDGSGRSNTMAENQRDEAKTIYSADPNYGNKLGAFMAISEWNSNKRTAVRKDKESWGKGEVEVNGTLFGTRNKEMKNAFLKLLETVNETVTA
jgi:phage/plasmid-like protein (TIGR03299 family)